MRVRLQRRLTEPPVARVGLGLVSGPLTSGWLLTCTLTRPTESIPALTMSWHHVLAISPFCAPKHTFFNISPSLSQQDVSLAHESVAQRSAPYQPADAAHKKVATSRELVHASSNLKPVHAELLQLASLVGVSTVQGCSTPSDMFDQPLYLWGNRQHGRTVCVKVQRPQSHADL